MLAALAAIPQAGCRKNVEAYDAIKSDANGYICPKCGSKFYTEEGIFAAKCPDCRELEIDEVWGHWCEECQLLTLMPRKAGERAVCRKCGQPTHGIKMPREQDLIDWGARKATEAQVSM